VGLRFIAKAQAVKTVWLLIEYYACFVAISVERPEFRPF